MTKRRATGGQFECTLCLQARILTEEGRYDPEVSGQDFGEAACTMIGGQSVCLEHFKIARQAVIDMADRKRAAIEARAKAEADG